MAKREAWNFRKKIYPVARAESNACADFVGSGCVRFVGFRDGDNQKPLTHVT